MKASQATCFQRVDKPIDTLSDFEKGSVGFRQADSSAY